MEEINIAQELENTYIDGGRILLNKVVGSGSFATVFHATSVKTNQTYAVKSFYKADMNAQELANLKREARILQSVSGHSNVVDVVKFIGTDDEADYCHIVMELATLDLFDLIIDETSYREAEGKGLSEETARTLFTQIVDSVSYCHANNVFHRDIKPENVLLSIDSKGEYQCKLADFGLSTRHRTSSNFECGSFFYMSPENLNDDGDFRDVYHTAPNDVWSLGVLLVNMLTAKNPWSEASLNDFFYGQYVKGNQDYLKEQFGFSTELLNLLHSIFTADPMERITVDELALRFSGIKSFFIAPTTSTLLFDESDVSSHSTLANDDNDGIDISRNATSISSKETVMSDAEVTEKQAYVGPTKFGKLCVVSQLEGILDSFGTFLRV